MDYKSILKKLKDSDYLVADIEEHEEGLDVMATINKRLKLVPLIVEGELKGVTLFIPVSHTDDVHQLIDTTAQVLHTITTMTTTAVLIDAVTGCGTDRSATIMTLLGMMSDGGIAKYKTRVIHVEGDFNITRNSQQGMIIISIFRRASLDIPS